MYTHTYKAVFFRTPSASFRGVILGLLKRLRLNMHMCTCHVDINAQLNIEFRQTRTASLRRIISNRLIEPYRIA